MIFVCSASFQNTVWYFHTSAKSAKEAGETFILSMVARGVPAWQVRRRLDVQDVTDQPEIGNRYLDWQHDGWFSGIGHTPDTCP